ncbi:hypothetical protein [Aphanothece microscopica]|uniref:hypothetical protein n=1 Tax=Aphanothece microscopica TaxID=1049561 RepID=UPI003985604C
MSLSDEQLRFLSAYLRVVPDSGWFNRNKEKVDEALAANKTIKQEFERYVAALDAYRRRVAEVEALLDARFVVLNALPKGTAEVLVSDYRDKMVAARSRFVADKAKVSTLVSQVEHAPADAPLFVRGATSLLTQADAIRKIGASLPPEPKFEGVDNIAPLVAAQAEVRALRDFADVSGLNRSRVERPFPAKKDEDARAKAVVDHDTACDKMLEGIGNIMKLALDPAQAIEPAKLEGSLAFLMKTHRPRRDAALNTLTTLFADWGKTQIDTLAKANNDVAKREQDRDTKVDAKLLELAAQIRNLEALVKSKEKAAKDFDLEDGYKRKRELIDDAKSAQERLDALKERLRQFEAYKADAAGRADDILRADDRLKAATAFAVDPATALARDGKPVAVAASDKKSIENLESGIANDLRRYTAASQRVSVDAKLFPGEQDLFDLTPAQFQVLKSLLEHATGYIAEAKKAAKGVDPAKQMGLANRVVTEARDPYIKFIGANKFALPEVDDLPGEPDSALDRLNADLGKAALDLDAFWGIGGDADKGLRTALASIRGEAGKIKEDDEAGAARVAAMLSKFRKILDDRRKAFAPASGPSAKKDADGKAAAGTAKNKVFGELTSLFRTRPLQEAEIGDIPPDRLIKVEILGGAQYYEIEAKRGGTQEEREDKSVPRETMQHLLDQANMLELMAESDVAGSGDAIAAKAQETEAFLAAVLAGKKDYDHILKEIPNVTKALTDSAFVGWFPADLQETRQRFDTFKSTYATALLPADARKEIDAIKTKVAALKTAAQALKKQHEDFEADAKATEKLLASSKKGKDGTLADKLTALVNGDAKKLIASAKIPQGQAAELTKATTAIEAALKGLAKADLSLGTGGDFRKQLGDARRMADAHTADGITNAEEEIKKLKKAIADEGAALSSKDTSLGALQDLAAKLTRLSAEAVAYAEHVAAAETARTKAKADLEALRKKLDGNKKLAAYPEQKNLQKSLQARFDAADKDKAVDARRASQEFADIAKSATDIIARVGATVKIDKSAVKSIEDYMASLGQHPAQIGTAATSAATTLKAHAKDDGPQQKKAAEEVAKVLEQAAAAAQRIAPKAGSLVKTCDDAMKLTDETARRAAIYKAREEVLAELRRVKAATDSDPSILVYRNNPIDRGAAWAELAGSLHSMEVNILKVLNPA